MVLLFLLFLLSVSSPADQSRTFHLIEKTMNQPEARAACRADYTDLATVNSEEDYFTMTRLTNNLTQAVWIGLQRGQNSVKWSNGDEVTFSNPSGSCGPKPCCAAMKADGSWESLQCSETRYFMCYKQDGTDLSYSYHLITQSLTWYEAQTYCRRNYTDLVSIRDQDQNEAVKIKGVNISMSFWIGLLHDDWEWADGGHYAYRKWAPGSPEPSSTPSPDCVQMRGGIWDSMLCLIGLPALCYKIFSPPVQSHFRTFHLVEENVLAVNGQAICRVNYTDLVTVYGDEDNTALTNVAGSSSAWIGLVRSNLSDKWSNGDEVTFSALTGDCGPNPCCAAMKTDGSWESRQCIETRHFMCYKPDETDLTFSYHLIPQSLTWYEAQTYCRKNYTDLVSIRDQDQNEAVKIKGMTSSTPFWIGLLRDDWEWADGVRFVYRNWGAGQPRLSSTSLNCTQLRNGKWETVSCINTRPALCYKTSVHVSDDRMSWESALDYCKKENRNGLLRIESDQEQKLLESELRRRRVSGPMWVGLGQRQISELLKLSHRLALGPWTKWTGVRPPSPSCGATDTVEKSFRVKTDVSELRAVCELKKQ